MSFLEYRSWEVEKGFFFLNVTMKRRLRVLQSNRWLEWLVFAISEITRRVVAVFTKLLPSCLSFL